MTKCDTDNFKYRLEIELVDIARLSQGCCKGKLNLKCCRFKKMFFYMIENHFHNPYNKCVIKSQKGHMYGLVSKYLKVKNYMVVT